MTEPNADDPRAKAREMSETLDAMQIHVMTVLGIPVVCHWEGPLISCQPAFRFTYAR